MSFRSLNVVEVVLASLAVVAATITASRFLVARFARCSCTASGTCSRPLPVGARVIFTVELSLFGGRVELG